MCQKQDVGSTVTEFYTGWSNHKSHINTKRKACTLAKHFVEQICGLQNLKLLLLKTSKSKIWTTLNIARSTGNASYLLCIHIASFSEKNLKGVPINLSSSITRFVCCSHLTQLFTDTTYVYTFLFHLIHILPTHHFWHFYSFSITLILYASTILMVLWTENHLSCFKCGFLNIFRAKTFCAVCHAYCFCCGGTNMAQKMSEKPHSI